jgi:uncharacterized protein YjbI with pentapeptide repeats
LVLPNFEAGDRVKFDAERKIAISSDALSLRGRSLEGAYFAYAHLKKADFTGARLSGADVVYAELHEAKFGCAFTGTEWYCAQMQGAIFGFAQLQGASLNEARLEGADLTEARLQGASLDSARLEGADLQSAQLQGGSLNHAELVGASLDHAQLEGASLDHAQLQGASLDHAQLLGATLKRIFVWGAQPPKPENAAGALIDGPEPRRKYSGLDCGSFLFGALVSFGKVCDWSEESYSTLRLLIESQVPAGSMREQASKRILRLADSPDTKDKAWVKGWDDLAKASPISATAYPGVLAKTLEKVGCAADGART